MSDLLSTVDDTQYRSEISADPSPAFNEAYAAAEFFDKHKKDLDTDKSGTVTQAELHAYESSHNNDANARYLGEHMDDFRLSWRWPFSPPGITSADIDQYRVLKDPLHDQQATELENVVNSFRRNFDRLDRNHSNSIDRRELQAFANDASEDAGARYMAKFMLRNFNLASADGWYPGKAIQPSGENSFKWDFNPDLALSFGQRATVDVVAGMSGGLFSGVGLLTIRSFLESTPSGPWQLAAGVTFAAAVAASGIFTDKTFTQRSERARVQIWQTLKDLDQENIQPAR